VLLRFATPSRLAPASLGAAEKIAVAEDKQNFQDIIDFVEAPLPGQPGAPEDMMYGEDDADEEGSD
jgi:hypothetical protein